MHPGSFLRTDCAPKTPCGPHGITVPPSTPPPRRKVALVQKSSKKYFLSVKVEPEMLKIYFLSLGLIQKSEKCQKFNYVRCDPYGITVLLSMPLPGERWCRTKGHSYAQPSWIGQQKFQKSVQRSGKKDVSLWASHCNLTT